MGRSVSYLSNAEHVAYINPEVDDDDSVDSYIAQENWQWFQEGLIEFLQLHYPSLDECKRWEGNEVQIILENTHCEIGLSEYGGLVSLSIRINDSNFRCNGQLAFGWINRIWPKLLAKLDKQYRILNKVGTFSNGEAVFQSNQFKQNE